MKSKDVKGICVVVTNNNVDLALKKFKKKIKESGIMIEIKNKEFFQKPSLKKRQAVKKSLLRQQNINKKNNK